MKHIFTGVLVFGAGWTAELQKTGVQSGSFAHNCFDRSVLKRELMHLGLIGLPWKDGYLASYVIKKHVTTSTCNMSGSTDLTGSTATLVHREILEKHEQRLASHFQQLLVGISYLGRNIFLMIYLCDIIFDCLFTMSIMFYIYYLKLLVKMLKGVNRQLDKQISSKHIVVL